MHSHVENKFNNIKNNTEIRKEWDDFWLSLEKNGKLQEAWLSFGTLPTNVNIQTSCVITRYPLLESVPYLPHENAEIDTFSNQENMKNMCIPYCMLSCNSPVKSCWTMLTVTSYFIQISLNIITQIPLKKENSGRVCISCSTSGTSHVNVIRHRHHLPLKTYRTLVYR